MNIRRPVQILIVIAVCFIVFDLLKEVRYVGDRDAFKEVAVMNFPCDSIYHCINIDKFISVDSLGNVYCFTVYSPVSKDVSSRKYLFNIKEFKK